MQAIFMFVSYSIISCYFLLVACYIKIMITNHNGFMLQLSYFNTNAKHIMALYEYSFLLACNETGMF